MNTVPISPGDEAAIRQLVQVMRDGQNSEDAELFASALAQEHDYVAVVHVRGVFRPEGQPEKKAENIMSAVMQKREDRWEIVSFHNAPVQKHQEQETGFVIRIEGVDAYSEGVRR
jgi:hypothetical protein